MKYAIGILVVLVVVLGLVAFAPRPPSPTVVAGAVDMVTSDTVNLYRFWSDGRVDYTRAFFDTALCDPGILCGNPPIVVIP